MLMQWPVVVPLLLALAIGVLSSDKKESFQDKSNVEGSGVSLDDYEEIDDQFDKLTASTSTTTTTTTSRPSTRAPTQLNVPNEEPEENEFKENYIDDLDDVSYDSEMTSSETLIVPLTSTLHFSTPIPSRKSSLRVLLDTLTRPPIAAGILVGKSNDVVLLFV
jgi:hypothetical protein